MREFHSNCFACGEYSKNGLKLNFFLRKNTLAGKFKIFENFQGYDDMVHGGIIATILDSSMVNLFYKKDGLKLKTAKLNIYFRRPIPIGKTVTVKAIVDNNIRHFYKAKSQIIFNNTVYAEAEGYFRK